MITEMSSKMQPSNNYARLIFAFFTAGGISLSLLSTFIPRFSGLVALCGAVMLVVAVTVFSRYVASVYYYDITYDYKGTPIFVVRQMTGKRQSTLCRIDIADIVNVEVENAKQRRAHKTPTGYMKYNYSPTLWAKETSRLTVEGKYEKSEIIIENKLYAEHLARISEELKSE